MRTRGRHSALSLLTSQPVSKEQSRLPPPSGLDDEEANEWVEIVNSMPAKHFHRVNQGLLEQYCRHIVSARRLSAILKTIDPMTDDEDLLKKRIRLQKQYSEDSRAVSHLLRSMRLTQQSIYRGESLKPPQSQVRPWDKSA